MLVLGAAALAGAGWLVYQAIQSGSTFLGTVIAAFATVVAVLVARYFEGQRDAQLVRREHLTSIYEDLIVRFTNAESASDGPDAVDAIRLFHRKVLLWGHADVVKSFVAWRNTLPEDPDEIDERTPAENMPMFLAAESFIRSLRKDMGISNRGLEEGDLLRVWVNDFDDHYRLYKAAKSA